MKAWILAGSTALTLLFATGAVRADVTPENVWSAWKAMATGYGETITASSETREGDTLVVKGIGISMANSGATVSGKLGEMRFKALGDGTVAITASDTYAMKLDTPAVKGQPVVHMVVDIAMPGMKTVASGTPEAMNFAVDAPQLEIHAEGGPAEVSKGGMTMDMAMGGATGHYAVSRADAGQAIDYKIAAKSLDISTHVTDPAQKTDVAFKATLGDVAVDSAGVYLAADKMANFTDALNAGFRLNTDLTYGAGTYETTSLKAGIPVKVSGRFGSGEFGLALDKSHFLLRAGSKKMTVAVSSKMLPIQGLGGSYGEFAFNLMVPLEKSAKPRDFDLLLKLGDLNVSDAIWGMFDPEGQLPHSPATIVLDTKGTVTLNSDLTGSGAQQAIGGKPPGLLDSFDVNSIVVKAAGAELTGAGGFTFDNTDPKSLDGFPTPTGTLTLKAVGLMGLIDKLVSMGVMPQDQSMQAKMMIDMFAKPGPEPNTLISAIRFKDKTLTINGMEMPVP